MGNELTDHQLREIEALARAMTNPLISKEDRNLLANILRERHIANGVSK